MYADLNRLLKEALKAKNVHAALPPKEAKARAEAIARMAKFCWNYGLADEAVGRKMGESLPKAEG